MIFKGNRKMSAESEANARRCLQCNKDFFMPKYPNCRYCDNCLIDLPVKTSKVHGNSSKDTTIPEPEIKAL